MNIYGWVLAGSYIVVLMALLVIIYAFIKTTINELREMDRPQRERYLKWTLVACGCGFIIVMLSWIYFGDVLIAVYDWLDNLVPSHVQVKPF